MPWTHWIKAWVIDCVNNNIAGLNSMVKYFLAPYILKTLKKTRRWKGIADWHPSHFSWNLLSLKGRSCIWLWALIIVSSRVGTFSQSMGSSRWAPKRVGLRLTKWWSRPDYASAPLAAVNIHSNGQLIFFLFWIADKKRLCRFFLIENVKRVWPYLSG